MDHSLLAPRASPADSFETNPLSALRAPLPEGVARHQLEDSLRVREALRHVIEEGGSVGDAARDWNVAPSSIATWRARYQALVREESLPGVPLFEVETGPRDHDLTHIPDAAREMFSENWNRLVLEVEATPSDFRQKPLTIFLQTSPLTSWLYQDGELERGLLAGTFCGVVALGILTAFLIADYAGPAPVALPEPPLNEDVAIDEAAAVAASFWEAPNWQERLKFIRNPESVQYMVRNYYQNFPDGPVLDAGLALAMPASQLVNLSFEIPSLSRSHFLCVVLKDGRYLVDWESSSLYQEAHLQKVREERSTAPRRVAVTVARKDGDSYYNYSFSEADWVCYQIGYPGMNLQFFGYARKESAEAITLDALLGILDQQAVVLEVRYPPSAPVDNQVEILKVLSERWVPSGP